VILIGVGPNLGALSRAALIRAEHVVVPLAPDLFSLQGLRNLGPTLCAWRREWQERRERNVAAPLTVRRRRDEPLGLRRHTTYVSRKPTSDGVQPLARADSVDVSQVRA
jgi:chromosome partitioning protein